MEKLRDHIDAEIVFADKSLEDGDITAAFEHLERAHVLGQAITFQHTRIHWRMLKIGWKKKDAREIFGQLVRIVGASTKTPFGIYPTGNTGGSDVWFFKPMPIAEDLKQILDKAKNN
ncbi:MAG: DUF3703 domain-containing protein [Pyrinomonadaceae bacterium]